MPELRIPSSTYRIQFSLNFRYVDGRDLVPYLNDLGITDLYSSPRFKARRGSPHAYDVANPLRINSELGTEDEFQELSTKLRAFQMGMLLDIVPNHMAVSAENPWWMDLLENGRWSIYAAHFAVDWERATAKTQARPRILLPILGDLYGKVLERGEITLKQDENGLFARYYETRLPLDVRSYALLLEPCRAALETAGAKPAAAAALALRDQVLALPETAPEPEQRQERHRLKELAKADLWQACSAMPELKAALDEQLILAGGNSTDPNSRDLLDRVLDAQHYRVAFWRMAAEELNYRRFFDITDLIGVRVEDPEVFEARHPEILKLVTDGHVTGFRVDHVDGLWDPKGYLARLRSTALGGNEPPEPAEPGCQGFYVVVEKILADGEELPQDWPVCGTTGYDFLNWLTGVFLSPAGVRELDTAYRAFTGKTQTMAEMRYERKKQVMKGLFPGEVRALSYHLARLAAMDRIARDLPFTELSHALAEIAARFPVYRSYVRDFSVAERDRQYIEAALAVAQQAMPDINPEVFAFVRRVLLLEVPSYVEQRDAWLSFVQGWQQFTGPCMAKGLEDTTFYNYYRLISQNEVGSDPELAAEPVTVERFHQLNQARLERWPSSMNATSTHDTKRSEDVRARINVLSEIPQAWTRRLRKWSALNERHKTEVNGNPAPDRNDEWMLYQTLAGAWPLCEPDLPALRDRIRNSIQKAVREAKTHSSWLNPDSAYEDACLRFVDGLLEESEQNEFLRDFGAFHRGVAAAGAVNALGQVLLKVCSPGVPDFYQGTELWDFSLVDPDNRRPVDFTRRDAMLDELRRREVSDLPALLDEMSGQWQDGRIKLYTTYKALTFRRAHPDLFREGEYLALGGSERACAFARRLGDQWAVAAVPRLNWSKDRPKSSLLNLKALRAESLRLPDGGPKRWRNVLTGEEAKGPKLVLSELFARFPVALLEALP